MDIMEVQDKVILIIGDCKSSSAQGVRYVSLFGRKAGLKHKMICYSPQCDKIGHLDKITVTSSTSLIVKILRGMQRRIIFPDPYILRLQAYKRKLKPIVTNDSQGNVIIGCTPFSLILLSPWIIRNNSDVNLIVDMSDPFSFNMSNIKRSLRSMIARHIEKISFPHIGHIVVLNEDIRDRYKTMYPMWSEKFTVVEQGVDEGFIEKVKTESIQENKRGGFTFLYAGGFYRRGRNPNELYKAFGAQKECCRLSIYGNIRKSLRPIGSDNIDYHRAIDKDQLARVTAQADALILMDNDYGYQVPGKTLETLASGKPVLFIYKNVESPTLKYIREAKGVVWAKNNAADIATAIKGIVNGDYEEPFFDYSPYTWDKMRSKYEKLLKGRDQ